MSSPVALLGASVRELTAHLGRTLLTVVALLVGILSITGVQITSTAVQESLMRSLELERGRQDSLVVTLPATQRNLVLATKLIDEQFPGRAVLIAEGGVVATAPDGSTFRVRPYRGDLVQAYPLQVEEGAGNTHWVNQAGHQLLLGDSARVTSASQTTSVIHVQRVVDDGDSTPTLYVAMDHLSPLAAGTSMQVLLPPGLGTLDDRKSQFRAALDRAGLSTSEIEAVDVLAELQATLSTVQRGFLIVGAATLLVGMLGVLNIGLATLGNRVEELSLRRALGATRSDIRWIVLLDAILIGVVSAAIGVGLAVVAFHFVMGQFDTSQAIGFPVSAAAVGVGAGLFAGTLGGLAPAIRASRMPIATVMRA